MNAAQREVYDVIVAFWAERQIGPTFRDICERSSFSSTSTIAWHVRSLADMGYLRYEANTPRSIRVIACEVPKDGAA